MVAVTQKGAFKWVGFARRVSRALRIPPKVDRAEWCTRNIRYSAGSEAEFFDFDKAPHVRGVFARFWDNPAMKKASLCWATRCTKTSTVIALMSESAANDPCPMAVLAPDDDSLANWLEDQAYPILDRCRPLKDQLPVTAKRNRRAIRFRDCRVRLAVGGAKNSASGYPARKVFKFEHDKNPIKKSREADPSLRIESRASGFSWGVKILEESTPEDAATSRVWKLIHDEYVIQFLFHVPCPHCGKFQPLVADQVRWKQGDRVEMWRDKTVRANPAEARRSAFYECEHCTFPIHNEHRVRMVRRGVWLADGESAELCDEPDSHGGRYGDGHVVNGARITGTPSIDSDVCVFGPLSKMYSMFIGGWGTVASEFVSAWHKQRGQGDDEPMRKFMTETLAIAWDPAPVDTTAAEVSKFLFADVPRKVVPEWGLFATRAIDVQTPGNRVEFPWSVTAWGHGGRGQVVDSGCEVGWKSIERLWQSRQAYAHADGDPAVPIAWTGMDSGDGHQQEHVYAFCLQHARTLPLKGNSTSMAEPFRLSEWIGGRKESDFDFADKRRRLLMGAVYLLLVNSDRSQRWVKSILQGDKIGKEDEFTVCLDVGRSSGYVDELLNEVEEVKWTAAGNRQSKWRKVERHKPNDQRDLLRYNWALAMLVTDYGSEWWSLPARAELKAKAAAAAGGSRKTKTSGRRERIRNRGKETRRR